MHPRPDVAHRCSRPSIRPAGVAHPALQPARHPPSRCGTPSPAAGQASAQQVWHTQPCSRPGIRPPGVAHPALQPTRHLPTRCGTPSPAAD
ncbi:hypothetical protein ACOMHN_007672 [Nucella lapillus]